MDNTKIHGFKLIQGSIGLKLKILSNNYDSDELSSHQEIEFQILEEDPDVLAFGVLFALSMMSFSYAGPRGVSEDFFSPDDDWHLGHFIDNLSFRDGFLFFSADYIAGRMMKTDIEFHPGGLVSLSTINRGKEMDRWVTHLQGKKHLKSVE